MTEEMLNTTLLSGSEPVFDLVCIPCNSAGRYLEAEGYCVDCNEHLCAQCVNYHKTRSASRYHKLEDKVSMPTTQTDPPTKDITTDVCQEHGTKVIEYFCHTHEFFGCSACVTLQHKLCEDIVFIPQITEEFENSQENEFFKKRLNEMIKKSDVIIKSSKENLVKSACIFSKVKQDISAFREKINILLDQLEEELKAKFEQINALNIVAMETVSSKASHALNHLQAISSEYQGLLSRKLYSHAFTKLKVTNLAPVQDTLKDVENTVISYCNFVPDEKLLQLLKGNDGLGQIKLWKPEELNAVYMTDINIRTDSSSKECIIKGLTLLSKDILIITNSDNGTVECIDLDNKRVTSKLKTEKCPWAVTTVHKDKVAVSLPSAEKILFLMCGDRLTIDTEVRVNGQCHGIAYHQDKLVVTFCNPSKMEILDMAGNVLQSFDNDEQGHKLFINPNYVSVCTDGSSVFVSDVGNSSLVKVSIDGKIQAVYTDDELRYPGQCVIDEVGLVYLCGGESNNIHLLTTECTKIKTVVTDTAELECPRSVCYCEITRRLYVGMYWNNTIKVYQLKT